MSTIILEEERHVRFHENVVVTLISFLFFSISFIIAWKWSERHIKEWKDFTPGKRADWASRCNSTIHAITIVIGVIISLITIQWGNHFLPETSIRTASFTFSIAIGYFLCDLLIIIYWPVDMQLVFIIHHTVAVIPYFINNFISCCAACQFGLLLFLLVELATLPLNARGFLETRGRIHHKKYTYSIYVTYFVWAISRMLLPFFLLYTFWADAYPSDRNHATCLYPNLVSAHLIAFFCIGVFFFIYTPEMFGLWRAPVALPNGRESLTPAGLNKNDHDEEATSPMDLEKNESNVLQAV